MKDWKPWRSRFAKDFEKPFAFSCAAYQLADKAYFFKPLSPLISTNDFILTYFFNQNPLQMGHKILSDSCILGVKDTYFPRQAETK
jgi:hypothetical protein